MRSQYEYLAVLFACLLVTAPLEWLGGGVYRRAPDVARAVLPVLAVLVAWDVVAIARGHWSFHHEGTTGVVLAGVLPIEEVLFFVAIPLCALLTYEAVRRLARDG
ncbi:lycopene cyclase domain-containing protein [Saccharothrix sp. S26]|uniref:lycopene cyclase domain-containing protein n=1 Tax=Saccharothrix sp. S26 TaxID=2907215 RepID=UPI001F1606F6|nr:lycopene cyclase domain-containing protein [Saccharothrix sp. S26]MCE7000955.1 lycopene cyclase domain-containing protein [Saccharothrix sp. S26]